MFVFQDYRIVFLSFVVAAAAMYFIFKFGNNEKQMTKPKQSTKCDEEKKLIHKNLTLIEVAKHNNAKDCWIIVDNKVYDVTDYIDEHPGGDSILNNAGGDSSIGVHGPQHPVSMWDVLKLYYIGDLKSEDAGSSD